MKPADALIRVVRSPEGELKIGRDLPGRGAWLCADGLGCVELAERRQVIGKALRGDVRPGAMERLRAELAERARIEGRADKGQPDVQA